MYAIYAKQSAEKIDSFTIEALIDMCKKECGIKATKVYSDRGFSGKNTNRTKFYN